jgi:PhoH-like ATPase
MTNKCKDVLASGTHPGSELKKIFVLDTNVLLHDPDSLFAFQSAVVGIPYVVLEELDTFKREAGELGRNAREAIRKLDELRTQGCLGVGVELNHNSNAVLKVYPTPKLTFSQENNYSLKDNLIIQTVMDIAKEGYEVKLITKDINVRVKADVLGLDSEDYTKGTISYSDFYTGWIRVPVAPNDLRSMTPRRLATVSWNFHKNENDVSAFYNNCLTLYYKTRNFIQYA